MRSERRIGELIEARRKAGALAKGSDKGGRKRKIDGSRADPSNAPKSLAEEGVDKHLADRGRKAWALSERKFEIKLAKAQKIAIAVRRGGHQTSARRDDRAQIREPKKAPSNHPRR
jgi:hypothetical protein